MPGLNIVQNFINPNNFFDPNKLVAGAAGAATAGAPAWIKAFTAAAEKLNQGDFFGGLSAMAKAVSGSPLEDTQKKQMLGQIAELVDMGKKAGIKPIAGRSVLMETALALGKLMDKKMDEVFENAKKLGSMDSKSSKYGEVSAVIDALNKELDFVQKGLKSALDALAKPKDLMQ